MRIFLRYLAAALLWLTGLAGAAAQGPAGFEAFYEGPTNVNLGGRPVVADIALYADMKAAERGDLRIALVTDVTPFIEETEQDLKNWVATNQNRCGERWHAGEPYIGFPAGALRLALYIELSVWNCGWNGKADPSRFALEGGKIDLTLNYYVEDGKLQASLGDFSIAEKTGVSKYLPLEFVTRQALLGELKKLNNNPKFYRAPRPLFGEGFVYESIGAVVDENEHVIITARYKGAGAREKLTRIADKTRKDGITQMKN